MLHNYIYENRHKNDVFIEFYNYVFASFIIKKSLYF